jgi:hypothetical protein
VVAGVVGVTAIVGLVGDPEPSTPDVSMALPPPVEPSIVTTAPVPEPPELALGWKELRLPGWAAGALGQVVDGGPSGWVAVTQGYYSQTVHTSGDGVAWRTTTLDEIGWIPTVFSGTDGLFMAVSGGAGGAGIWRSVDGGLEWERSSLPGDEAMVVSLAEAAGRVWAAGMADTPDPWSTGTPAVWVLEEDEWVSVPLEGNRGWVASVVEWDGGVWAFGSDLGPVAWDLVAAERHEVMPGTDLGGFRTVVAHQGALWGLYSTGLSEAGRLLTAASGPTSWDSVSGLAAATGLALEPIGERVALVHPQTVRIVGGPQLPARFTGHTTGRESTVEVAGMASVGERAVILGRATTSEAMLWIRETVSEPIVVLDPDRMAWSARRQLNAVLWGPMVVWDDRIFMVGDEGVYEWALGTKLVEVPGGWFVNQLVPTEDGLLGLRSTGVVRLEGNEFLDFGSTPIPNLCAATVIEGELTVSDCGGGVWRRESDGEWSEWESTDYQIVGALDGAFLAYHPETGELGVTVDGITLQYPGQVVTGPTGQHPFVVLERRNDSTTVRLIEPWPGGATFQVPTPAPIDVSRVGDTLRVRSPSTLFISTDLGRSWTEVPIGVENGFPEGGIFLPTEALMVIAPNPDGSGSILYTPRS